MITKFIPNAAKDAMLFDYMHVGETHYLVCPNPTDGDIFGSFHVDVYHIDEINDYGIVMTCLEYDETGTEFEKDVIELQRHEFASIVLFDEEDYNVEIRHFTDDEIENDFDAEELFHLKLSCTAEQIMLKWINTSRQKHPECWKPRWIQTN